MSKSKSIYVWNNVDNIIQRIESQIDFNYHTTDLYDSQLCSKEDEDCSFQSLVKKKKPFGVGYGFKSNCFPINECFSKLQGCCQYIRPKQELIFPQFHNDFYLHQKISY